MSLVKAIYNAPITYDRQNEEYGWLTIGIKLHGHYYYGWAFCDDGDKDFYSEKVGHNIALSRARINAMEHFKKSLQQEVEWKRKISQEVKTPEVKKNYERAEARLKNLSISLKEEKSGLRDYISAQAQAIESIKRFRSKAEAN